MKENNPMKLIDREKIEFESTIETIKLLLATINPDFKQKYLNSLMEIIAWSGAANDEEDQVFMSKLLGWTEKNIQKYFYEKDDREMEVMRNNLI
jgi:hypothetical protein